jgi:hypothetical protein
MKKILIVSAAFIFSLYANITFAQGCSDAGFCSIDGMKHNEIAASDSLPGDNIALANAFKTGLSLGNTRYDVWILNSYATYSRQVNGKLAASVKIDGQYRTGKLTQIAGFSDITISMSYKIYKSFGIIAGGKIPLSGANRTHNEKSMPMAYQTSLGTYDAILGAQYIYKKMFIAIGWQQPLIQNANTFLGTNFTKEDLGATYLETNNYKRAGDVLLRASYYHNPESYLKKFAFTYSLLPIYHLKNDTYTNAANKTLEIEGSKGLTLNTNLVANYAISTSTAIELSTGFPLIARKVRPDGMSQFAATLELIKKF